MLEGFKEGLCCYAGLKDVVCSKEDGGTKGLTIIGSLL